MKKSKILFVVVFALVAIVFALYEYDTIPRALIADAPSTTYTIDLLSAATAFGGCFVLLRWFRIGSIRRRLKSLESAVDLDAFCARHSNIRLVIWLVLALLNIVLYYEAPYANNPKYCIIVLCIAGIFCWPSVPNRKDKD